MKSYLVIGGCGFIGSHLCDRLQHHGNRVIVDDLSSGRLENVHTGTEVIIADACDVDQYRHILDHVDGCFFLAAISSVEKSNTEWISAHNANLVAFINLLSALASSGNNAIPIVFTSSAAVYGDLAKLPARETDDVMPLSPYAVDKLGCEVYAKSASQMRGMKTTCLRLFNVFGPRQDPTSPHSGVISVFLRNALAGQPLTINGDGEQTRDFIYVDDVVDALLAAVDRPGEGHEVINVCSGRAVSINSLATEIFHSVAANPSIFHGPGRVGDIRHSLGDRSRMTAMLGIGATLELREGLAKILEAI